jgi:hypothetical protein
VRRALGRFEQVKQAYVEEVASGNQLRKINTKNETILKKKDNLLNWYTGAYTEEQTLRQDSNKKLAVSQGKVTRRGWIIALETLGLALLGYASITH